VKGGKGFIETCPAGGSSKRGSQGLKDETLARRFDPRRPPSKRKGCLGKALKGFTGERLKDFRQRGLYKYDGPTWERKGL